MVTVVSDYFFFLNISMVFWFAWSFMVYNYLVFWIFDLFMTNAYIYYDIVHTTRYYREKNIMIFI